MAKKTVTAEQAAKAETPTETSVPGNQVTPNPDQKEQTAGRLSEAETTPAAPTPKPKQSAVPKTAKPAPKTDRTEVLEAKRQQLETPVTKAPSKSAVSEREAAIRARAAEELAAMKKPAAERLKQLKTETSEDEGDDE